MMGRVYLIHFDQKLHHARHYIGYTRLSIEARISRHHSGDGAKLLRALDQRGIGWRVARVWENQSQEFERKLKNRKNAKKLCPVCRGENHHGNETPHL